MMIARANNSNENILQILVRTLTIDGHNVTLVGILSHNLKWVTQTHPNQGNIEHYDMYRSCTVYYQYSL